MYTIAQLKSDLAGILHGISLNKIVGINDVISRAARHVILDVDLPDTKRTAQLPNPIFDQIYDYILPTDLKGEKIIRFNPIQGPYPADSFGGIYSADFDYYKNFVTGNKWNIRNNSGVKTIRVNNEFSSPRLVIDTMDSLTGIVIGGGFASLVLDTVQYLSGTASLRVTATGTTGYLEKTLTNALDMSLLQNMTSFFDLVYVPDPTTFTSVQLRIGSGTGNYFLMTATSNHLGTWNQGWNVVRFDWDGATQVGTPVLTAMNYYRLTANYTGIQTGLRFDSLTNNRGVLFEMEYYSKYMFRSLAGVWQETVLADTDLINADTDSYNLLLYKTAELAALNTQEAIPLRGKLVNFDQTFYGSDYDAALKEYKQQHKSEAIVLATKYYRTPYNGRRYANGYNHNLPTHP